MGVYIPDMELPNNCFQCPAHEWFDFGGENHGYQCPILRTTKCISNCKARTNRRDNCQMIYVAPHGRLIDAYVFIEMLEKLVYQNESDAETNGNFMSLYKANVLREIISKLKGLSTMIPASNV